MPLELHVKKDGSSGTKANLGQLNSIRRNLPYREARRQDLSDSIAPHYRLIVQTVKLFLVDFQGFGDFDHVEP